LAACGAERASPDGGADAGVDARVEGVDPPVLPSDPMPPAPPVLTPCRTGWVETDGPEGVRVCEPYAGPTPESCPAGEAPFPGEGCAPVGDACPTGEFRDDLPATNVVYVRAGATGGDGTRAAPFGSIAAARDAAAGGATIALAKGTFREDVYLRDGESFDLVGACPEETLLEPPTPNLGFATVEVSNGALGLANLTVTGPRPGVRIEGAAASATLRSVIVEDTQVVAVSAYSGGRIDAERLVVRRTAQHPDGDAGRAVNLEDGGTVAIAKGVLEDSFDTGLAALSAADEVTLEDVLIRRTRRSGEFGENITVAYGASLEADGLVLETADVVGMLVLFDGSHATLRDSLFRNNGEDALQVNVGATASLSRVRFADDAGNAVVAGDSPDFAMEDVVVEREGGRALSVQEGGTARAARVVAVGTGRTSFIVASDDAPSSLTLDDALVRGPEGAALMVQEGGRATVTRFAATQSLGTVLVVRGAEVTFDGSDLDLYAPRRPGGGPLEENARGIEVRVGATATVTRLRVASAFQNGIFIEDATATMTDVIVRDGEGRDDTEHAFGRGLEAHGAMLSLERFLSERNTGVGLFVGRGAQATVRDATILDTFAGGTELRGGDGFIANGGAVLDVERAVVAYAREAGIGAFEVGTEVRARNIVIIRTTGRDCPVSLCGTTRFGIGVGSYLEALVSLERFAILESVLAGIQVADNGNVRLTDGEVGQSPIGINVQVEGFQLERDLTNVRFIDIERNIDAEVLPLPDTALPSTDGT
jgi:hypothetical protein